ncbi:MAG: dTDP-glucose 4,6-dehydratase [Thermodesulfobacteria bacterium]|nr:dTDP-glucose 4,6-dehydratase [Thermodesulfobacteriota bacterium]
MKRILVTGGCGFIGTNFIRLLLEERDYEIINLDALTYAGNPENLAEFEGHPRYRFVKGRIEDQDLVGQLMEGVDAVVNFAAESHVDRSIKSAKPFITTNVLGTQVLLDAFRKAGSSGPFVHVSTDEVYGSLTKDAPPFREDDHLLPNSPYSASKASSDLLCRAAWKTFGLPVVITRCSNNYGPYQFPEKLIPLMIINCLQNRKLPIYGDGLNIRDWIYVKDHCRGVLAALEKAKPGAIYNFGGDCELTNLQVVETILEILGKGKELIEFVKDRPGHDRRYAMDSTLAKRELGWSPQEDFDSGIRRTVRWYLDNQDWWQRILSGQYRNYYQEHYGKAL